MSGGNFLVSLREMKLFEKKKNKTKAADERKYRLEPSTDEKQRPRWRKNRIMKLYICGKIMDINLDSLLLCICYQEVVYKYHCKH